MSDEGESKNIYVTSHGQMGGITAGEFHQHAPQPGGTLTLTSENEPWVEEHRGTSYVTKFQIQLEAAYAARALDVYVEADQLGGFEVVPMVAAGMTSEQRIQETPNQGITRILPPLAHQYEVLVYTVDSDMVEVSAQIM